MTPKSQETSSYVTEAQWRGYIFQRDQHLIPHPDYVERFDGSEFVAWSDVPEVYQKKILEGTMSDQDWVADWDASQKESKPIEDVVSDMLNDADSPVAKHVHVWRKEYRYCMIKGCGSRKGKHIE